MSRGEPDLSFGREIHFVTEQIGVSENEFKESTVGLLHDRNGPLRAYLAQVRYGKGNDFNVALCVVSESVEDEKLVNDIALVFREIFGLHEHLDILFLTENQEAQLRKVCCPFFSSTRFDHPDFYLTSSEGYGLEEVRACYEERRLMNGHPDGYMLCEVDPPVMGQPYGLGGEDIHGIVIASRYSGYSLFPVSDWPASVHVARLTRDVSDDKSVISENDIDSIGWEEVYKSSFTAKASLISR